jgi:soluble lytic murein transglycosylase-like protein
MTIQQQVEAAAVRYSVPVDLAVRLAMQESGLRQFRSDGSLVVSSAGAIGVMQLMPATAAELGVDPRDTAQNIAGGMRYLRQMFDRFGSWKTAVAAYNAGPGRIGRVLAGSSSLPAETAGYVLAIMREPWGSSPSPPPNFRAGQVQPPAPKPGQPKPRARKGNRQAKST